MAITLPISTGLYDHLDISSNTTLAATVANEFRGRTAIWVNRLSLPTVTLPITVMFVALDLMPTAIYSSKVSFWWVNQMTDFIFTKSGLAAWVLANIGLNISPSANGLGLLVVAFTALMMFLFTLTPTVAGMLLSSFAKVGFPYAGLVVHFIAIFDAVTDWGMAASISWGGFQPLMATVIPDRLAYFLCYPLAGMLTFFNSSLLEVFCVSLWIFHYHLWHNSRTQVR